MSKNAAPAVTETVAQGGPVEMTLQEFCTRLSAKDRRVELLKGFFAYETGNGCIKGTEDQLQARFEAFVNKPV